MHGEDESSAEDRLARSTHGRNLWLTYDDDARLTAADGSEKRYKAKARQIALGIRMLLPFKIELFP
jgi:YD repeat-containing protein